MRSIRRKSLRTGADMARVMAQAKSAGRPQVLLLVQRQKLPARFVGIKLKS